MTTSLYTSTSPFPGYEHRTPAPALDGKPVSALFSSSVPQPVQFGRMGMSQTALPSAFSNNLLARGVAGLEMKQANMKGSAFEWAKMAEHTLGSTGSRLIVSNSPVEMLEIAASETIEGLVVFFGLSALANRFLLKPMACLAKVPENQFGLLKKTLKDMPTDGLKHHLPARVATIVAAMGATLAFGEFAMLFAKNIASAKFFNRGSFSQLLDLEEQSGQKAPAVEETVRRSTKGLKASIVAGVASLIAAATIAKMGPKLLSGVTSKRLAHFRKVLSNTFGGMDFESSARKTAHGMVDKLGLSLGQMRTYMAISGVGYMLAARDKLERMEILPRFTLIFLYLGWFKELFEQKLLFPFFKKRLPELIKTEVTEAGKRRHSVQSVQDIIQSDAFKQASSSRKARLASGKASLFLAPYVVGMGVVSLLNAAINRYLTHQRFEQGQQQKALNVMGQLRPLTHA